MKRRSQEFRPSLLVAISARLIALLLGVSFVGTAPLIAETPKRGDTPAASPRNETQKLDSPRHEVRLHFRLPAGMAMPADFRPEVYGEKDRDEARLMWQPENRRGGLGNSRLLPVHSTGPGEFEVQLPHPEQPFYVAVFAPGFLRFFERGPFKLADLKEGNLEIAVEKPASLEVHFDPGDSKPQNRLFDGQRLTLSRIIGRDSYVSVAAEVPVGEVTRIADLAAGDYSVRVNTNPKPNVQDIPGTKAPPVNPGDYCELRKLTLAPGQSTRIDFKYQPFDINVFRGQRTAVLRFVKPDGSPAAARKVWIGYFDGHYGSVPVYSGPTSASGEVTLENITDRVPDNSIWRIRRTPYSVFVGERLVRNFGLESKARVERFTILLAPDVGDPAPDVDLIQVAGGKHVKLSSLRGKFVCVDFWATWCVPCQTAMKELDQLAAHEPERWKDRLAIVPLSIDEKPELVARHLAKRGWTHLAHYWAGPGELSGYDAPAAKRFVVDGVPTSFLIAPDDRILWRGSPLSDAGGKRMKERIEEALGP